MKKMRANMRRIIGEDPNPSFGLGSSPIIPLMF
jgi:hypothetical protein